MRLVVVATLLLCLTQCSQPRHRSETSFESQRQRLALAAASQLPATFAEDCALLGGGRDAREVSDLGRQAWLNGCEQFKKLGHWKSLDETASSLGSSNDFVLVEGRAVFDAGEYRLQSFWSVANGRADIFFLGLKNGTEVLDVPNYPASPSDPLPSYRMPSPIRDPPMGLDAHS
jgi:hypothetical protein